MRILVSNDDSIHSEGIRVLTELAARFGEVYVCAPETQCSAMSQKMTLTRPLAVTEYEPLPGSVFSCSVDGCPADAVKLALEKLLPFTPDIVFSGVNHGCNCGYDIAYSGTIGAAMEALMHRVPAIAFSVGEQATFDAFRAFAPAITEKLLAEPAPADSVWNVNVPAIPAADVKGVLYGLRPMPGEVYGNRYREQILPDGRKAYLPHGFLHDPDSMLPGTDAEAVLHGYISVGLVKNMVL